MSSGDREWLPADVPEAATGSVHLTPEEWTELEGVGRLQVGDGTFLHLGESRVFFAPAHTPAPGPPWELPPAPHGTTVEVRLFGLPYRWQRATQTGQLRLQRIETPVGYRELMRAHVALADANGSFRGVGPAGG